VAWHKTRAKPPKRFPASKQKYRTPVSKKAKEDMSRENHYICPNCKMAATPGGGKCLYCGRALPEVLPRDAPSREVENSKNPQTSKIDIVGLGLQLDFLSDDIDRMCEWVGANKHKNYKEELEAFVFVLGCLAIYESKLGKIDKHKSCVELEHFFFDRFGDLQNNLDIQKFLHKKHAEYAEAIRNRKGEDWATSLANHFLMCIRALSPDHNRLQSALYRQIHSQIKELQNFVNDSRNL
jgi:hypothetical protein